MCRETSLRPFLLIALCASAAAAPFASNKSLQVRLNDRTNTLTVADRRTHRVWEQKPLATGLKVTGSTVEAREIRLTLRDSVNNLDLTAVVTLAKDKPEFEITLSASGPLPKTVAYPSGFASDRCGMVASSAGNRMPSFI